MGRKIIPSTWNKCWKVGPKIRTSWQQNEGENEAIVLDFFLQIGLTESMVSCAEMGRKIIPSTWNKCGKVTPEIRTSWQQNEGENEAIVLDFFLQMGLTESMVS